MNLFFLFFFLCLKIPFTYQQYQQSTHLSGSGKATQVLIYGNTGKYDVENSFSAKESTSFLINSNSELLICFGEINEPNQGYGISDQIWKYSIEKREWQFVKGRKKIKQKTICNELNTFSESIEIGSRKSTKGWINKEIITFFGGYTISSIDDQPTELNEHWRYNVSSNEYSVIRCNECDNVFNSTSKFTQFTKINEFHNETIPGARINHEIVQINEKEILLIGGKGYSSETENIKLGDWYIFSTELMLWKYGGGDLGFTPSISPQFGKINTYEILNRIGSIHSTSGVLVNEEEVLLFGGLNDGKVTNSIFKYNISNNNWKYIAGNYQEKENGKGYFRSFNSSNYPGSRIDHKIWKLNNNELVLFGGYGYQTTSSIGNLNDEWKYNINLNLWSFTGKEKTKFNDREPYFNSNINEYSDATLMGGLRSFVGEYIPEKQELIICNGYGKTLEVINGNLDDCWSIFYGNMCNNIEDRDPKVCYERGICSNHNFCECDNGFFGENCELTKCNGILSNETEKVCSKGKGICINSKCLCYEQTIYNNPDCSINEPLLTFMNTLWIYITVPIIIFALLVVIIVVSLIFLFICTKQKKNLKKFDEIEDVDIILEEQKLAKDSSVAHFRINKKMFEIDPKEIKIIEKIGDGGSSAVVYSAIWNNQKVGYKCFAVQDFLDNKYAEFEKEVELLSSISFPFILTFFGATLNSQRLGFVMEYAENGDLENFLKKYRRKNGRSYSFLKKLRMLFEISSAMLFLHNKKIIHRDLKPLNVLVTSKEDTKLMDFGLSKIVDDDLTKTKKVGTSFFIAPEVLLGKYGFACDVFSFSMLMFVVLTENYSPFAHKGVKEFNIFLKISKDPNFRPNLQEIETKEIGEEELKDLKAMIQRNWRHDETERMKFEEISEFLEKLIRKKKAERIEDIEETNSINYLKEELLKKDEEIRKLKEENAKLQMFAK